MTNFSQIEEEIEPYLTHIQYGGKDLIGVLNANDFSLGGSSEFSQSEVANILTNAISGLVDKAMEKAKGKNNASSENINNAIKNHTLQNTINFWESSSHTTFSIQLTLIPGLMQIDGTKQETWKKIADTIFYWTQPKLNETYGFKTLSAPAGLENDNIMDLLKSNINPTKLDTKFASIRIGKWFKTTPVFYITDANLTLSVDVDEDDVPLYGTLDLSFSSYRVLDYETIASFYLK